MLKPVSQKILIRPDEINVQTEGGLIKVVKEIPSSGTVIEISPDIDKEELRMNGVKEGSRVRFFNNHRLEENECFLIDFENIWGVENELTFYERLGNLRYRIFKWIDDYKAE